MIALLTISMVALVAQDAPEGSLADELALENRLAGEFPEAALIVEHELANGWRFLLLPRKGAPVVSFETYVAVGSIDEAVGDTGMAHLFEHMAFKGSDRIGTLDWEREQSALARVELSRKKLEEAESSGDQAASELARVTFEQAQLAAAELVDREEFSRILEEAGGLRSLNASTSADETRFVISLPSNQIELWCWMEAERFARPVFRELYSEREAILEERRLRVESNPFGSLLEALQLAAFQTHPYRNPVIGFPDDIRALDSQKAKDFFAEFYGTRNRITAIIGDIDPERLIPMLERTCGRAPEGPAPRQRTLTNEKQNGERRVKVDFPANPLLALAWHVPGLTDPFSPALEIAIRLLGQGPNSRLENRLVREDGTASEILSDSSWPGKRSSSLAVLIAIPTAEPDLETLEASILEEIARLAKDGPTEAELAAAKISARTELLRAMQDSANFASVLLEFEAITGDWREAFRRIHKLEAVGTKDVQRVLERWFVQENQTTVTLAPALDKPAKD